MRPAESVWQVSFGSMAAMRSRREPPLSQTRQNQIADLMQITRNKEA